jgi:alpha-tubulin suppressor-like RCC1 family protein
MSFSNRLLGRINPLFTTALGLILLIFTGGSVIAQSLPTITTPPRNMNVARGMPVQFSVSGTGGSIMYSWLFNGEPLPGANDRFLNISEALPQHVGEYRVALRNSVGTTTSDPVYLILGPIRTWGLNVASRIPPLKATNLLSIVASTSEAGAVSANGEVLIWPAVAVNLIPPGLSNVVALALGNAHALTLKSDGTVIGSGNNSFQKTNVPAGIRDAIAVAAGSEFSVILRRNGIPYAWGNNASGQTSVTARATNLIAISARSSHTLGLASDGTVVAWGRNTSGECDVPIDLTDAVAIGAGAAHSVALRADGTVIAWGNATSGQTLVPAGLSNVIAIAVGDNDTAALTAEGSIVGWGRNSQSILKAPSQTTNVIGMAIGADFMHALENDGSPQFTLPMPDRTVVPGQRVLLAGFAAGGADVQYQWRHNGVDLPDQTNAVLTLPSVRAEHAGEYSVVASNDRGSIESRRMQLRLIQPTSIASWGLNGLRQVYPPAIASRITKLAGGGAHALALLDNGRAVGWGDTFLGPSIIPANAINLIDIAAGRGHSIAVRIDGSVVSWGGTSSKLTNQNAFPLTVQQIIQVAAGESFSLALRRDGTVVTWADATPGPTSTPSGLSNVVAIAAGHIHAVALKSDGTVFSWGDRFNREANLVTNVPPGLTDVKAIAAGGKHTLALKHDGTVVAWGINTDGQTNVPPDLTNVVEIAAGVFHSVALRSDGTVAVWGSNQFGESQVPEGLTNVLSVAAGRWFTLALVGDSAPVISTPPRGRTVVAGGAVEFTCTASGTPPLNYQWRRGQTEIPGATASSLSLEDLTAADAGEYQVIVSNALGKATSAVARLTIAPLVSWGAHPFHESEPPDGITAPAVVSGGVNHSVIVQEDGSLVHWGNLAGHNVPPDLGPLIKASAGKFHTVALRTDGTVVAWGDKDYGQNDVPPGLNNVIDIAAGWYHSLALTADGRVVTWGLKGIRGPDRFAAPAGLSNVVDVAAGGSHSVALTAEGKVWVWGENNNGQFNVPADLAQVVAISAGEHHVSALQANGQVRSWGGSGINAMTPPAGLTNVVAIASGNLHVIALRNDGTLVTWGRALFGEGTVPSGLPPVIRIGAGSYHNLAIPGDGRPVVVQRHPPRIIENGATVSLSALVSGRSPLTFQWQFNGADLDGASGATLTFAASRQTAGVYRCIVRNELGVATTEDISVVVRSAEPLLFEAPLTVLEGVLRMRLSGLSGAGQITVYTSTNLFDWEVFQVHPATSGAIDLRAPLSDLNPARYFKATEGP